MGTKGRVKVSVLSVFGDLTTKNQFIGEKLPKKTEVPQNKPGLAQIKQRRGIETMILKNKILIGITALLLALIAYTYVKL